MAELTKKLMDDTCCVGTGDPWFAHAADKTSTGAKKRAERDVQPVSRDLEFRLDTKLDHEWRQIQFGEARVCQQFSGDFLEFHFKIVHHHGDFGGRQAAVISSDVVIPATRKHRVGPAASIDGIVAISGDNRVVALTRLDFIVAISRNDQVVATERFDPVVAVHNRDRIIPGTGFNGVVPFTQ